MAKADVGPLADCITGKSGNMLFSTTRKGQVISKFREAKNPRSPAQQSGRNAFQAGQAIFKRGNANMTEAWSKIRQKRKNPCFKQGKAPAATLFTGALIQSVVVPGEGDEDLGQPTGRLEDLTFIPATRSGIPTPIVSFSVDFGEITMSVSPPVDLPFYTLTGYLYFVQLNVNPRLTFDAANYEAAFMFDDSTSVTFEDRPGAEHVIGVSARFKSTEGAQVLYSRSMQTKATPPT